MTLIKPLIIVGFFHLFGICRSWYKLWRLDCWIWYQIL